MQEERRMILKMIEDGTISAEEGIKLLTALGEKEADKKTESASSASSTTTTHSHEVSQHVDVDRRTDTGYKQSEEKMSGFASKFSEFVDDAVNKIKELDLDFNFGSAQQVQHVFQHKDVFLKEADIHIENGSIELRPWNEKDIRIECDVQVYRVRSAEEARREFLRDAQFSFSNGKLRLESRKKTMKVNTVIYFPTDDLEKIKLYTFNGKISGEEIPVHVFSLKAVNGKVNFSRIDAKEVAIETVNGTIDLGRLNAVDGSLKTMNGTVRVEAARGNIDAESVNGSIYYHLSEPSQSKAYVKTTTGSIHVYVPNNAKTEGELKSTVGSINCHLPTMSVIEEKKEFANKRLTFIANKEGDGHFYIEAEAATGSVNVKNS
ncbi:DUF4097 domain-containing protein [Paenalkalicoccus suaedae]|uniref:DUF4097 domain-containing protein n=1 Tax=Paenalkalicoccus suaedae TaxID=2592382 RepID=A0A859FHX1_9BACI|nr:DUF4097 domain-containing protein [Paenalkalicoccus suaedae]QKS72274.1 DUF4097 domain-containing protein [Paenalkalicoccus suaedae]